jgi:antitoxin ParD1/3/4
MPTRNISLTREQDEFIAKAVEAGEYQNASEAVRDALRALQQRRREDKARLAALRERLRASEASLKRGEYVDVELDSLGDFLEGLAPVPARKRR